jgi:hypothetical protein
MSEIGILRQQHPQDPDRLEPVYVEPRTLAAACFIGSRRRDRLSDRGIWSPHPIEFEVLATTALGDSLHGGVSGLLLEIP